MSRDKKRSKVVLTITPLGRIVATDGVSEKDADEWATVFDRFAIGEGTLWWFGRNSDVELLVFDDKWQVVSRTSL